MPDQPVSPTQVSPQSLPLAPIIEHVAANMPGDHTGQHAPLNVIERTHNLIDLTVTAAKNANLSITKANIDQLISTAEQLYDRCIAPLNVPGIPDTIEPAFDRALRNLIGPAIRAVFAL